LCITTSFAQSTLPKSEQDSLWAVWSDTSRPDTSRMKAMYRVAMVGYVYSQPDSAFHYAQLLYDQAASKGLKEHMAGALNIQGNSLMNRGYLIKALEHFQRSMKLREQIGDENGVASSLNNIGIIYHDQEDLDKALHYYQRSLDLFKKTGSRKGQSNVLGNMGIIHYELDDQDMALHYLGQSLRLYEEIGDEQGRSYALNNLGDVHFARSDHTTALDHYERSIEIKQRIGDKSGLAHTHHSLGLLMKKEKKYQPALSYCREALWLAEEVASLSLQRRACLCLYDTYKAMGSHLEALVQLEKIGELDKQMNKEETAKKLQQMEFQQVMLQDSIAKAEEARLVQEAHQEEVRRTTRSRNALAVSGSFLLLLAGGFYSRARYMRRSRAVLQVEKDRSENLLLNILPAEIAEELKQKGRCEARDFDLVSILFTDFKDFTEHSATMSAAALVNEINHCFEAFDGIMAKYGIEKIKTIGDAYMAAGGLPVPTEDSVKNTVLAALEMQHFIKERKAQKDALGEPAFEMRVGIHTGPVVAGIVGVKKFQYDIWGDTVNTASRMESSGVVGQVNISESTHALVKDAIAPTSAPLFQFQARGYVRVKGKGELEMFLVQENDGSKVDLEQGQFKSTSA
jgi:adenylate cyclase